MQQIVILLTGDSLFLCF